MIYTTYLYILVISRRALAAVSIRRLGRLVSFKVVAHCRGTTRVAHDFIRFLFKASEKNILFT